MANTQNFNLEKPVRGSYFGTWHTPVNANMDLIDAALQTIKTSNKTVTQDHITEEGTTWWNTALKLFYIHNGSNLVQLVTENQFIITLDQQQELTDGYNSITNLHSHPGYSTQFFKVKDPTTAVSSGDLANKQYFAIPYKLFNDTVTQINTEAFNVSNELESLKAKVDGITDGINVTIGTTTATGDISTTKGLIAAGGTTGTTIKIGGGSASGEVEIVTSTNTPINFKTRGVGEVDLQVQGYTIWHKGNMGKNSELDADKVDECNVDDTVMSDKTLWTSAKIMSVIENGVGGIDIPDTSGLATKQELVNHKGSNDHDTHNDARYAKKSDIFNVPIGGTILLDTAIAPDWAIHFDGTWTGLTGSVFEGWKICTGQNGTTNLIDKFVLGGGPNATFPVEGGASKVKLTKEQMPRHAHFIDFTGHTSSGTDGGGRIGSGANGAEIITGFNTQSSGGRVNIDADGECQEHENMPPYVAMIYMTRYK